MIRSCLSRSVCGDYSRLSSAVSPDSNVFYFTLMLICRIAVYKTEKTHLGPFLNTTKATLQSLASLAQDLERVVHINPQKSVDIMSKGTRHVVLLYHMCVIVTTRPLLLSVLMELLELDQNITAWKDLLAIASPLVSTGVKSASKTLQILSDEDNPFGKLLIPSHVSVLKSLILVQRHSFPSILNACALQPYIFSWHERSSQIWLRRAMMANSWLKRSSRK